MTMIKAAVVQNCATTEPEHNLSVLERLTTEAVAAGAQLVAWAEFATAYGIGENGIQVDAHPQASHHALKRAQALAKANSIWLLSGSLGIAAQDGRTHNRSFLLDPEGGIAAHYDKVHLFDVDLAGGESYRESDTIAPGNGKVTAELLGTKLGMSICYDVRFAYLYRALAQAGAQILSVPAAFAAKTGQAHWHVLLRARAIETGCFVIAPGQCGQQADGRLQRYGHSLIIAPWGEILAEGDAQQEGWIMADLDLSLVDKARRMVPALKHDRDL